MMLHTGYVIANSAMCILLCKSAFFILGIKKLLYSNILVVSEVRNTLIHFIHFDGKHNEMTPSTMFITSKTIVSSCLYSYDILLKTLIKCECIFAGGWTILCILGELLHSQVVRLGGAT